MYPIWSFKNAPDRARGRLGIPALVAVAWSSLALASALASEPVAYVIRMSEPCSRSFELQRAALMDQKTSEDEAACRIGYFSALQQGDQIIIDDPDDWLELLFNDGRTRRLTWGDSPFNVNGAGDWTASFNRLLRSLFELFASTPGGAISTHSAVSRGTPGGPFEVPIFDGASSTMLVAGERPFTLEWNGGVPPFRVELARHGDVALVGEWRDIESQALKRQSVDLKPGGYQITVRDAAGERRTVDVKVIEATAQPHLSRDVLSSYRDVDIAAFVNVAWLVGQDGAWRLESYIRAFELASRYPPAEILVDRLAEGRPIPLTIQSHSQ